MSVLAPFPAGTESVKASRPRNEIEKGFQGDVNPNPRAHSWPVKSLPVLELYPPFSSTELEATPPSPGAARSSPPAKHDGAGPSKLATKGSGPALFPPRSGIYARANTFPAEKFESVRHHHTERRALRSMHTFPRYKPLGGDNSRGFFWDPSDPSVAQPLSRASDPWGVLSSGRRGRDTGEWSMAASATSSDVFYSNLPSIVSLGSSVGTNPALRFQIPTKDSAVCARGSEESGAARPPERCAEGAESDWQNVTWHRCGEDSLSLQFPMEELEAEAERELERRAEGNGRLAETIQTSQRNRIHESGWRAEAEGSAETEGATFGIAARGRAQSVPPEGWRMATSGTADFEAMRAPGLVATDHLQQRISSRLETERGEERNGDYLRDVQPLSLFPEQAGSVHDGRVSEPVIPTWEDERVARLSLGDQNPTQTPLLWNPPAAEYPSFALRLGQSQNGAAASDIASARGRPSGAVPAAETQSGRGGLEAAGTLPRGFDSLARGALEDGAVPQHEMIESAGGEAEDAAASRFGSTRGDLTGARPRLASRRASVPEAREPELLRTWSLDPERAGEVSGSIPVSQKYRTRDFGCGQQSVTEQELPGTGREWREGQPRPEERPHSASVKRRVASEDETVGFDEAGEYLRRGLPQKRHVSTWGEPVHPALPAPRNEGKGVESPAAYTCRFCGLTFLQSAALGGHMSCHREGRNGKFKVAG
ncbi:hypothetical protein KFL_002760160 [Klebsormidium nitens]|uniref:C2H2-type domain-containing protein n=1 Tax=Klebsormidium nitens TaxID=105231 RepID=A0A1Y1I5I7_KLENI|nr:hypothetical protein KFL_002760160 [Klebsormidium nitens]|eukprot:GAQ86220.1 hypothetical protein KFL_002760160 [Klebsormidium nitens]